MHMNLLYFHYLQSLKLNTEKLTYHNFFKLLSEDQYISLQVMEVFTLA